MSSEWSIKAFAELMDQGALEIGDGYRAKNDELGGDGLIFLRAGHVKDSHVDFSGVERFKTVDESKFGRKIAKTGDVVITTKGNSTGRLAVVTAKMPRFVYSPHLSYWRSTSGAVLDQGFLRAWARSPEFAEQLAALSRSTDMAPYLSLSDQRRLQITLPSTETQREIAGLNDALSARLQLLRETNGTLEAIAQALFKSWFVDFDPVRAKMEGRRPEGMDEATAALFPDGLESLELGSVPKEWRYVSLKEVVSIFDSQRIPLSGQDRAKRKGPFPYYGAAALMDSVDHYLFDGIYLLTGEDGSVADADGFPIMQYVWGKIWVNNHAHVLQGKEGVSTEHLMLALKRVNIQPFITGAVQAKLSQANMWRIMFLKPPRAISESFGSLIDPLFARIRYNSEQAQTLTALRDTLLPRLISGQLRLPEAAAMVNEAS